MASAICFVVRHAVRSTLGALTTVVLLVLLVVAFIRGLEGSLAVSGDPNVVLVYSIGAAADIENSAIPARTSALLSASLDGVEQRFGVRHVMPELYIGTKVQTAADVPGMFGIVRGVTPATPLLRRQVQMLDGKWPGAGEVLVGKLTAAKLGCDPRRLQIGKAIRFDGRAWRISGRFTAGGAAFESEIWTPLTDLQAALRRQDLSLVAVGLTAGASPSDVELFCKERDDLELQAVAETSYYAGLQKHYQPVRGCGEPGLRAVDELLAGANPLQHLATPTFSVDISQETARRIRPDSIVAPRHGFHGGPLVRGINAPSTFIQPLRGDMPRSMPWGPAVESQLTSLYIFFR